MGLSLGDNLDDNLGNTQMSEHSASGSRTAVSPVLLFFFFFSFFLPSCKFSRFFFFFLFSSFLLFFQPSADAVVTKRGDIIKKNVSKNSPSRKWVNAFGVTFKGTLFFYKDNPANKRQLPNGVVNLYQASAQVLDYKKRDHILSLSGPDFEFLIQATDEGDLKHWVTALNEEASCAVGKIRSSLLDSPSPAKTLNFF